MKVGNAMILMIMTAWMLLVEEVSAAVTAVAAQVESTAGSGGKSIITICADRSRTSSSSVMTGCVGWTKLPNRVWGGHHRAIVTLMAEEDDVPPTADDDETEEEESDEAAAAAVGGSSTTTPEIESSVSVQQYEDVPSSEDDDDENNTKATMNTDWEYKDGLLIASGYNDAAQDGEDERTLPPQCLGLDTYANYGRQYLTEHSCKPYYPVTLHDCPPAASSSKAAAAAGAMEDAALSRHLRFLVTENGQLQSLIPVLDSNAEDVMRTHPYCLTILAEVDPNAEETEETDTNTSRCKMTGTYLMPCVTTTKEDFAARTEGRDDGDAAEVEDPSMLTVRSQFLGGVFQLNYHREQYFTVTGTAAPFLLALQRDWGYDDVVEMVYHFGLKSSSSGSSRPPLSSLEAAMSDSSSPLTRLSQTFAEQVAPEDDDNEDYSILIRTAEEHDLLMIETPGKTSHGFIEFVPSDYRVSGPMTAALQGTTTIATVSTTAFEVEPYQRHVNCPRQSSSSLSLMSSNTKIFVGVLCGVIVASIIIMLIVKTVCIDVDDTDNKDYVVDNNDDDATTGKDTVNTDDHSTASSSPSSLDEESLGALDEKA